MELYVKGKEAYIGMKVQNFMTGTEVKIQGWYEPLVGCPEGRVFVVDEGTGESTDILPCLIDGKFIEKKEYKFVLNGYETAFLKAFWEKQKPGSPDNDLTADAIHIVERNDREWVECESGDIWIDYDNEYEEYSSFAGLIDARIEKGEELPRYEDVLYERVNDVFITDAHDYIEAYGINAYSGNWIDVWCPVAFFFIRDEARKYKDGYQRHNCIGCRIYTYSLGNHNQGDLPVFRDMLLRMGEQLSKETEEK